MTIEALDVLAEVRRLGGDVKLVGPDRLRVVAPAMLLPDLAERVRIVKPKLLVALAKPNKVVQHPTEPKPPELAIDVDAHEWRARHHEALSFWGAFHTEGEAAALAWGEMVTLWHRRHGERTPPDTCAGCYLPIGGLEPALIGPEPVHLVQRKRQR